MSAKRTAACRCGSTLTVTWSPARDATVAGIFGSFWAEHSGEGHGHATVAEAGAARRKAGRTDSKGAEE